MRDDWEKNNKALSDKMRRMSKDLNEKSESVQYTVFEAMQTIMDYIEESFENVMLPCTPGKALEGVISKSVFRYRKVPFYPTNIYNVSFYEKFINIDIDAQY